MWQPTQNQGLASGLDLRAPMPCCGAPGGVGWDRDGTPGTRSERVLSSARMVAPGTAGVGGSNMPPSNNSPPLMWEPGVPHMHCSSPLCPSLARACSHSFHR